MSSNPRQCPSSSSSLARASASTQTCPSTVCQIVLMYGKWSMKLSGETWTQALASVKVAAPAGHAIQP